jgi:hypothetical protein
MEGVARRGCHMMEDLITGNSVNRVYDSCLYVVSVYAVVVYLSPMCILILKRILDAEHLGNIGPSAPHDS